MSKDGGISLFCLYCQQMYKNASRGNFAADSNLSAIDILHFELIEERAVLEKEQKMSRVMIQVVVAKNLMLQILPLFSTITKWIFSPF